MRSRTLDNYKCPIGQGLEAGSGVDPGSADRGDVTDFSDQRMAREICGSTAEVSGHGVAREIVVLPQNPEHQMARKICGSTTEVSGHSVAREIVVVSQTPDQEETTDSTTRRSYRCIPLRQYLRYELNYSATKIRYVYRQLGKGKEPPGIDIYVRRATEEEKRNERRKFRGRPEYFYAKVEEETAARVEAAARRPPVLGYVLPRKRRITIRLLPEIDLHAAGLNGHHPRAKRRYSQFSNWLHDVADGKVAFQPVETSGTASKTVRGRIRETDYERIVEIANKFCLHARGALEQLLIAFSVAFRKGEVRDLTLAQMIEVIAKEHEQSIVEQSRGSEIRGGLKGSVKE